MNIFKYLIDIWSEKQKDLTCNKHIRFTNSVAQFICYFIIKNIFLSINNKRSLIAFIRLAH